MTLAHTTAGPVRGRSANNGGVVHFGGVPYAVAARFAVPEVVPPWIEVRDASTLGPCPPQVSGGLDLVPGSIAGHTSEDCLTAEVWTPSCDGSRPVVMWIPGGSYLVGGAALPTYDGAGLAADGDVVVIGVNYRLGALGFLALDGVPSNLALRDLHAAIAWVSANASAFGGDPSRVILMGESAGAGAIAHLLLTATLAIEPAHDTHPDGTSSSSSSSDDNASHNNASDGNASDGTSHNNASHDNTSDGTSTDRAQCSAEQTDREQGDGTARRAAHGIRGAAMFSGAPGGTQTAERAAQVAAAFVTATGGLTLAELRTLPLDAVLAAQQATVQSTRVWAGAMPFHPWIDGELVPASPIAADLAPVPLIVGTTAHEMELFRPMLPQLPAAHAVGFIAAKGAALGLDHESAAQLFEDCGNDLADAIALVDLVLPADRVAARHAYSGHRVWRTSFTWEAPVVRACHALDLPFLFGTLDVDSWRTFAGADGSSALAADMLSLALRQAVAAFARDGAPSCDPIGEWPTHPSAVALGRTIAVVHAEGADYG